MKKFRVTYENLCILFGDRTFNKVIEAPNANRAVGNLMLESNCVLKVLCVEEI